MPVTQCFLKGILSNCRDGEEKMEGHNERDLERDNFFKSYFCILMNLTREPIKKNS